MNPPTRSEIFRANLHRLAAVHEFDVDDLAAALEWRQAKKKWLQRVWNDGLERADKRTERHLAALAKALGIEAGEFWTPNVLPRARSFYDPVNPWLRTKYTFTEWPTVVGRIRKIIRNLPVVWSRDPARLLEVRKRYRTEEQMIAAWVAFKLGKIPLRGQEDEQEILKLILEEPSSQPYGGDLIHQVIQMMQQHARWKDMVRIACDQCEVEYNDSYDAWDRLPDNVAADFRQLLLEVISRPLMLQEAMSRIEVYFGFATSAVPSDEIHQIIEELQTHVEWDTHLRQKFAGDPDRAYETISDQWMRARLIFSMGDFTSTYRKLMLDDLVEPDDVEIEHLRHGDGQDD